MSLLTQLGLEFDKTFNLSSYFAYSSDRSLKAVFPYRAGLIVFAHSRMYSSSPFTDEQFYLEDGVKKHVRSTNTPYPIEQIYFGKVINDKLYIVYRNAGGDTYYIGRVYVEDDAVKFESMNTFTEYNSKFAMYGDYYISHRNANTPTWGKGIRINLKTFDVFTSTNEFFKPRLSFIHDAVKNQYVIYEGDWIDGSKEIIFLTPNFTNTPYSIITTNSDFSSRIRVGVEVNGTLYLIVSSNLYECDVLSSRLVQRTSGGKISGDFIQSYKDMLLFEGCAVDLRDFSVIESTDPTFNTYFGELKAYEYKTSLPFPISSYIYNQPPSVILNTNDNQTLSESAGQNELLVEGSTVDTDPNNTVTVKLQINNGTIRNITSAVSDGSTPIEFTKLLTYSNKRVYDGATPLTVDLAEDVDHTLKVWAEDDQGGKSEVIERKFQVIHNRPPVITGTDSDLGTLIESPSVTYQVSDLEAQSVYVTEKINGQVIRSFEAEPNTDYTVTIPLEMWIPLQLEQHTLTIEAMDSAGLTSIRTYTFTRIEDTILLELRNPFVTDVAAERILVTPDVHIPIGASIKIEACNNAYDENPTWEDITGMAMANRGYNFTNQTKTADKWGINIRITLEKGTATQQVILNGFGGAFE